MHVRAPEESTPRGGPPRALRIFLSAAVGAQLLGTLIPGPALWGAGHLAYLPLPRLAAVLWSFSLLFLLWSPLAVSVGPWLVRRVEPVVTGPRWLAFGVVPLVGMAVGWVARDRTHLLGDGILVTDLLAKGALTHGLDALGYHLQARIAALAQATTFAGAARAAAVTSTLSGGLFLAAAAWAARRLARQPGEALTLWILVVLAASSQLYLGYVECYAPMTVCVLLFAASWQLQQRGQVAPAVPAAWLAFALVWHPTALFVSPLLVAAVVWPSDGASATLPRRAWRLGWPLVVLVAAAVAWQLAGGGKFADAGDLLRGGPGRWLLNRWDGPRGFADGRLWKDVANLVLLVAPVPLALLVAGRSWRPPGAGRGAVEFALLGLLVPVLLLHFKLGLVRDWDLLAAPAVAMAIVAFAVWTERRPRAVVPSLGLVLAAAVGLAAPWFAVNAVTAAALRRLPAVTADLPAYPRAMALIDLGRWYREAGDLDGAREAYRLAVAANPDQASAQLLYGQVLVQRGEIAAAAAPLRRASDLAPDDGLALAMLLRAELALERPEAALAAARKLAGRPEEDAYLAAMHGVLAEHVGESREAVEAYVRAVRLDPARLDVMRRIGDLELAAGRGPRAAYAYQRVLDQAPADSTARVGLARARQLAPGTTR